MEFNSFIFRPPRATYSFADLAGNIIFIPKIIKEQFESMHNSFDVCETFQYMTVDQIMLKPHNVFYVECIPCLFIPHKEGSSKIIVFFHGNSEDIGRTFNLLQKISDNLGVHIISVEYQGYGIYEGNPSEKNLYNDCELIIFFLIKFAKWKEENIILFGRSIGSGPGTYLASKYNVSALILMSAFTSMKEVVGSHLGFLNFIVKDQFRNIDNIKACRCPVFILHGNLDKIVPVSHSKELHLHCKQPTMLVLAAEMNHNDFDFDKDLMNPLRDFFKKLKVTFEGKEILYLPMECFYEPIIIK